MSGCKHKKKDGALGLQLKWCPPCAQQKAGPKPKPKFQVGWYAIADNLDGPGTITRVRIHVVGEATDTPCWMESVQIQNGDDCWEGPADMVTRLVAEPEADEDQG